MVAGESEVAGASRSYWLPVVVALVLTLLGAQKPVVVDETIYLRYADAFAAHPADPYGFEMFWYDAPEPAHKIVVPPVVPYWLAAARVLFGQSDVAAKLSLFPFALAFAFGLAGLLRRFAPRFASPLLWMIALSPTVLTSFNAMLDLPALGLSLLALATFMVATDTRSLRRALLAGLLAGLAMQTKYTGALAVASIVTYALLFARPALAVAATACAVVVFVGWETVMHQLYGQSHFLYGMGIVEERFGGRRLLGWSLSFFSLTGALLATVGWLALAVLRPTRWVLPLGGGAIALAFAIVAQLPKDAVALQGADYPILNALRPELFVFGPLGLASAAAVAVLFVRELVGLFREWRAEAGATGMRGFERLSKAWRDDAFVLVWLGVEVAGFFVLSPYPAARRVLGMGIAATVLVGRVASRDGPRLHRHVAVIAGCTVALGLVYLGAELSDGRARREAVEQTVARVEEVGCSTGWYAGHWGFQHYADLAGLRPVVPGRSRMEPGDCLAIPVAVYKQRLRVDPQAVRELPAIVTRSAWPWRSIPSFYVGPVPLRAQSTAHVRVRLFRVVEPHVPAMRAR